MFFFVSGEEVLNQNSIENENEIFLDKYTPKENVPWLKICVGVLSLSI